MDTRLRGYDRVRLTAVKVKQKLPRINKPENIYETFCSKIIDNILFSTGASNPHIHGQLAC
jgi:hypothetical protein